MSYQNKYLIGFVDVLIIGCGIISAALGLEGFLLPNHFLDGGVTGIAMFISELTGISLSFFLILVNIPFIIIGWKNISKQLIFKGIATIASLAIFIYLVEMPVITNDKLLSAVFGGFFLGSAIGLVIRRGSVLDGTEIMALLLSKKTIFTIGDIILIFNIVFFVLVGLSLGIERAMYSILTYIVASKSVDLVIHGFEEFTAVTIISAKSEEIRNVILNDLGRGVTVYKGKRGMTDEDQDILYCVVTRLEIPKIKKIISQEDDKAFIVMHKIDDTVGGLIKKNTPYLK